MRAFYDIYIENTNELKYFRNGKHVFREHFHDNIEIFVIKTGRFKIFSDGNYYILENGDIAFFDSYIIHGYIERLSTLNGDETDDAIIIIPYSFTDKFKRIKDCKIIKNNIIHNPTLASEILDLGDKFFNYSNDAYFMESFSNIVLSLLLPQLELGEKKEKDDNNNLIKNLLAFTNDHYRENISLTTIAQNFGYSEAHLSRIFHTYFKNSFPNYVNSLRLNYINLQKKRFPKEKITSLIFEAGFNSIQSYYRNKEKMK